MRDQTHLQNYKNIERHFEDLDTRLRRAFAQQEGQLAGVTILIEGFLRMPWYRRVWFFLTGRFDRSWAVREVRKAYDESRQAARDQETASQPPAHTNADGPIRN